MYLYVSEEDNWNSNTIYYNFLKNPDDSFFGKLINFEDEKLDSHIFQNYDVLAFATKSNYNFTLESYYLSDTYELELTLNEYAIYEDFQDKTSNAFGGIFIIPKNQPIEDVRFYINKTAADSNYIVHKKSLNMPNNYYTNYSEKLITEDIIKNYNFNTLQDFYIKLITSKEELENLYQSLEFIDNLSFLDSAYSNLFSYRNILLCARNSNGNFYCEPDIQKDFYSQDIWSKNLKINEYIYETSQENYITYYSLIPLPKSISLENIYIERKERKYENFEDTKVKVRFKEAEKIAQNYLNTTTSLSPYSSLDIFDLNRLQNSIFEETTKTPYYKRLWSFRDEYFNKIYVDATTGEIFDFNTQF